MQVSRIDTRIDGQKNIGFGTKKLTTLVNAKEAKPVEKMPFDSKKFFERMKEISRQSNIHLAKAKKIAKEIIVSK